MYLILKLDAQASRDGYIWTAILGFQEEGTNSFMTIKTERKRWLEEKSERNAEEYMCMENQRHKISQEQLIVDGIIKR